MSEFYCKWGVYTLCEHELHTLEKFNIGFWAQRVSVTVDPVFTASGHILSDTICSCYWRPIYRGGRC